MVLQLILCTQIVSSSLVVDFSQAPLITLSQKRSRIVETNVRSLTVYVIRYAVRAELVRIRGSILTQILEILQKTIIIFGKNWFRSSPRLKIFSNPHQDKIHSALTAYYLISITSTFVIFKVKFIDIGHQLKKYIINMIITLFYQLPNFYDFHFWIN